MMELGERIRSARERKGLGRAETARRAGIPKDTLKKIELGKTGVSLPMLEKIATALSTKPSELLQETNLVDVQETAKAAPSFEARSQESETVPATPERVQQEDVPEYWILQGDRLVQQGHWQQALAAYEQAEHLMPRKDYTWARLSLERLGDMLIYLNAFERLEQTIALVEEAYQQPFRERYGDDDHRIRMLIEEKRAWKETWAGETLQAEHHAKQAYHLAHELGDEPRVEPTGLHFAGRAMCEPITTVMLYHRLFPSLILDTATRNRLQEAVHLLSRSTLVEEREYSKAFNAQWTARTLRTLNLTYDARKQERYWRHLFAGDEAGAEARLDQAKLLLLEEADAREALIDAEDMLREIVGTFQHWQYAPGLAEVALTQAYINFLGHRDKTVQQRRQNSDLCVVALCVHPYPKYAQYQVALRLLRLFIQAMQAHEYQDYQEHLKTRLVQREGDFKLLRFVFSVSDAGIERVFSLLSGLHALEEGK